MTTKFIALDVETGGIGTTYSLLSAYFLALDEKFNKIDDLYLFLKPDDGAYVVCGEAMNVNRIDLKVHDTKAIIYREAGTILYKWLSKMTSDGKNRAYLLGHNVKGDRDKVVQFLLCRGSWEKFISHRLRDTQASAGFLVDSDILPSDLSCSLESLAKYFNIPFDENVAHDAKYDTERTVDVYKELTNLMKNICKSTERKMTEYGWYCQNVEDEIADTMRTDNVSREQAIIDVFNQNKKK
jgi:DNA polymerase III epsilon subunit-like protein